MPAAQRYREDVIVDHASTSGGVAAAFAVQPRTAEQISAATFLNQARALAERLPHAAYVINACESRFEFLVVWYAAMLCGQASLLPSSKNEAAFARLAAAYPDSYRIGGRSDALPHRHAFDALLEGPVQREARLPSDTDIAAVFFTSGSTGESRPHAKTWGQMCLGAHSLRQQFSMSLGATLIATVPPQHMFGFETTVMLPVTQGFTVLDACPLLPADIEAAVKSSRRPSWLITTPLHLSSLRATGIALQGLEGILCATMPLEPADAAFIEDHWACPVYEIYGSTETGMVGHRRPAHDTSWSLCDDLFWDNPRKAVIKGVRIGASFELNDVIERQSSRRFRFVSRADDIVKIAGKRASLGALNAELCGVPGVCDGAFFAPADNSAGNNRLVAFVVAPAVSRETIVAALREKIDSAFLPRRLIFVDALPRNPMGKLPRAALEDLARNTGTA